MWLNQKTSKMCRGVGGSLGPTAAKEEATPLFNFAVSGSAFPGGPGGRRLDLASVTSSFGHREVHVPFINYC